MVDIAAYWVASASIRLLVRIHLRNTVAHRHIAPIDRRVRASISIAELPHSSSVYVVLNFKTNDPKIVLKSINKWQSSEMNQKKLKQKILSIGIGKDIEGKTKWRRYLLKQQNSTVFEFCLFICVFLSKNLRRGLINAEAVFFYILWKILLNT